MSTEPYGRPNSDSISVIELGQDNSLHRLLCSGLNHIFIHQDTSQPPPHPSLHEIIIYVSFRYSFQSLEVVNGDLITADSVLLDGKGKESMTYLQVICDHEGPTVRRCPRIYQR